MDVVKKILVGLMMICQCASLSAQLCLSKALPSPSPLSTSKNEATSISADQVFGDASLLQLSGNVVVHRGSQNIRAQNIAYQLIDNQLNAVGDVAYEDIDIRLKAKDIFWDMGKKLGKMNEVSYVVPSRNAHGQADAVRLDEINAIIAFNQVSYTTCDYNNQGWLMKNKSMQLFQEKGVGIARHAVLSIQGIPLLYSPYLSFPLDEKRRSGLLAPSFSNSDEGGFDFSTPYYLNIAASRDALIIPRVLSKRGFMLGTEFRYLTNVGLSKFALEIIPNDRVFGGDRGQFSMFHQNRWGRRLLLTIDLDYASDTDYFEDFGDSLSISSITHLEKKIQAVYRAKHWSMSAMLQNYQTIDTNIAVSNRPYQRLPQLLFHYKKIFRNDLQTQFDTEWTYFDKDDSPTGARLDSEFVVSWQKQTLATFITPSVTLQHSQYSLNNLEDSEDNTFTRTVPTFSLDSGIFFERGFDFRRQSYLQTLEPRLFYVYTPEKAQDHIPVFDSGELNFNYLQLFQENRFSGSDRIADANQVSLAMSTRFIDDHSGIERLRISAGQIYFFDENTVQLPDVEIDTRDTSAFIAEVSGRLNRRLRMSSTIQWDSDLNDIEKTTLKLNYKQDKQHLLNFSYRLLQDALEQTDISMRWPIRPQWSWVGRWNYSINDSRTLETFAGFEYDSCCIAYRLVYRDHVNDELGDRNQTIYFQLVLKGLSKIGNKIDDLLERGILGYDYE